MAELVPRHPLRGFDAIHLAGAVRLRSELAETVCFIAADSRLLAAALRRVSTRSTLDRRDSVTAADWVCEVISPSTGRLDRSRKMPIYGRAGIGHLWLVDPLLRTLEIYRLDAGRWTVVAVHGGDTVVRAEPFDAIELHLDRWWLPEPTEPGP